tara:strand:- start:1349 stop:2101 length:753 start_codon:yes stop_codon:yes gene_type:complete
MKDKTVAIIQARMTSRRLPGKVLKPLCGAPLLERMLERLKHVRGLDAICLAVPEGAEHDPVVAAAPSFVSIFRGDENNVLERTYQAARYMDAKIIMRITSDCPVFDPDISGDVLSVFCSSDVAYARTAFISGYPHGFDTEVFSYDALSKAHHEAQLQDEREHVTPFIWRRPSRFPMVELDYRPDRRHWRLTVDTWEDYELISKIYDYLYPQNSLFGLRSLEDLFNVNPNMLKINHNVDHPLLPGTPGVAI